MTIVTVKRLEKAVKQLMWSTNVISELHFEAVSRGGCPPTRVESSFYVVLIRGSASIRRLCVLPRIVEPPC